MVFARSTNSRVLLCLVFLEAIIVIVCESLILTNYNLQSHLFQETVGKGLPIYFGIFVASQVFQVILVLDAVRMQNTIQMLGFVFFNLCCLLYSILQFNQLKEIYQSLDTPESNYLRMRDMILLGVVTATISLCQLVYVWLAYRLYQEFGWRIYKKIGADLQKRRMYRDYHICLMLLKLDLFFFLGFGLQFLMLVLSDEDVEFALTIAALPVTLVAVLVAAYALRREGRTTMIVVFIGLLACTTYFSYKISRIWAPDAAAKYQYTKKYLTTFAALSLLAVLLTLVMSVRCFMNFGRGLRPYLMNESSGVELMQPGRTRMVLEEDEEDNVLELEPPSSVNNGRRTNGRRLAAAFSMQL